VLSRLNATLWRILTCPFTPAPTSQSIVSHGQSQEGPQARVTVSVLDAMESREFFGMPLAHRGIQPVYLRIENRSDTPLRLQLQRIDPNYYTPLEAAAAVHYSIGKRLTAFGFIGWLFLPLLTLIPLKLITAYRANRRMNDFFQAHAFHLRPIKPGDVAEGFVFTPLDIGAKIVRVSLYSTGESLELPPSNAPLSEETEPANEFTFSVPVPGLSADYLRRDFKALEHASSLVECDEPTLDQHLREMPPATSNTTGTRAGDPVNLVVIGEFELILAAFAARWDECESITLATCWKTMRAFLLGSQYRYSPVSPLHLFGRSQDVALQRTRRSINNRLHLRLWLTPLRFHGKPVWVGQVSRDIGVRFTTKVWNLTTHRVDPDIDEARDYVIEDLMQAQRIAAAAYIDGVGACDPTSPRRNLTGDPYFTDGKRAAVVLSATRTKPRFVAAS
jgi:hypothetical protein